MKNKILFIALATFTFFAACKKDNVQPNNNSSSNNTPPAPTTGTLYFKNTQVDPYTLYLDGTNIGVLVSGTTSMGYVVTSGISHTVKATQYSGYILYPTVYNGTATLNPGGSVTWSF